MPTIPSLVVGLVVLSAVFWLIERWRPALPGQRRRAADTRVDVAYWFFTPLVTRAVTRLALGIVFVVDRVVAGPLVRRNCARLATSRQTWASSLPLVRAGAAHPASLADLLAYWTHRFFHARWLWPFHAIHHSSTTVDWLSSVRLHPVNDAVARIVQVLPLYWMGFNGARARGLRAVPDVLRAAAARQRRLVVRAAALRDREPRLPSLASHVGGRGARQEFRRAVSVHRPGVRHVLHARRPPAHAFWRRAATMYRTGCSGSWRIRSGGARSATRGLLVIM